MAESPHILVVDDDTRLRELLRRYLSEHDFIVSVASDAAGARTILSGITFDLLVLDVMMPGEDGLSLTKSIRQNNNTPILLLTARGEVEDRIAGLERGADDYLVKPFEPRELLLRISTILRRSASTVPKSRACQTPAITSLRAVPPAAPTATSKATVITSAHSPTPNVPCSATPKPAAACSSP